MLSFFYFLNSYRAGIVPKSRPNKRQHICYLLTTQKCHLTVPIYFCSPSIASSIILFRCFCSLRQHAYSSNENAKPAPPTHSLIPYNTEYKIFYFITFMLIHQSSFFSMLKTTILFFFPFSFTSPNSSMTISGVAFMCFTTNSEVRICF